MTDLIDELVERETAKIDGTFAHEKIYLRHGLEVGLREGIKLHYRSDARSREVIREVVGVDLQSLTPDELTLIEVAGIAASHETDGLLAIIDKLRKR